MKQREFKFRIWNGNEMLNDIIPHHYRVYKVMQYTGVKDRHGKGVYEGDIDGSSKHGERVVVWDEINLCYILLWVKYFERWKKGGIAKAGCTYEKVTATKKLNIVGFYHPYFTDERA